MLYRRFAMVDALMRATKNKIFLVFAAAIGLAIVTISHSMTTMLGQDLSQRHRENDYGFFPLATETLVGTPGGTWKEEPAARIQNEIKNDIPLSNEIKNGKPLSIDISQVNVASKKAARRVSPPDNAAAEAIQIDSETMILVGGYTDSFRNVSKAIQFFNISSQKWLDQTLALPEGVAETHQGLAFDRQNRILYIVSGQLGSGCMPATKAVVRLHVDSGEFEFLPPLPIPRYAPGVVLVPDENHSSVCQLHVFGGASENRNDSATDHWRVQIDDRRVPAFWKWEALAPLPDAGTHGASFLSKDGYLYYTSFCNLDPGMMDSPSMIDCHFHAAKISGQRLHHVSHAGLAFRYPTALTKVAKAHWERVSDMPFPVCHGGSLVHDDKLYVVGGSILTSQTVKGSAPTSWPAIQVYDPKSNAWQVAGFSLPRRTHLFLLSTWVDEARLKVFALHPGNALLSMNLIDQESSPSTRNESWIDLSPRKALADHYWQQTTVKAISTFQACLREDFGEAWYKHLTMYTALDPEYPDLRGSWNKHHAHKQYPDVVVQPFCTQQVSAIVQCAKRTGYHVCGRNGRHSYDGTTCTHGIVVDVSKFQTVELVDAERGHVRLGAGLTLGQVVVALEAYGLALPAGTCSSVGLTGLTLNGGQGPLSRLYGMTSDHLTAVELVDDRGDVVQATDSNDYSDLAWYARGGGAVGYHYPGIITGLEFSGLPSIPRNTTLWTRVRIQFLPATVEKADQLLSAWQDWHKDSSNCGTDDPLFCRRIAAEPWLLMEYRRRKQVYQPAMRLIVYFYGTEIQHERFLSEYLPKFKGMTTGGTVVSIERLNQLEFHRKVGGLQQVQDLSKPYLGHDLNTSWFGLSAVAGGHSMESRQAFQSIAEIIFLRQPRYRRYAEFKPLGGAISASTPPHHGAFWHRQAHWWVLMNHFINASDGEQRILKDFSKVVDAMGDTFQGEYAGYVHHGNSTSRDLERYYGGNAGRIQDIKRSRDPHNLFRNYLPNDIAK